MFKEEELSLKCNHNFQESCSLFVQSHPLWVTLYRRWCERGQGIIYIQEHPTQI